MHLDQWLSQVYDSEILSKEASGLDAVFSEMEPEELLSIAIGQATVEKLAGKMTLQHRESLPSKSFAVPESKAKKIGVSEEIKGEAKGKYPIPDEKRARNALARVSQFGNPAERVAVRKKVYSKYPQLREGFEQRHGESPTTKKNIKKVEQGGIGKAAGMGDFLGTMKRNPNTKDLNRAFAAYEKDTGKRPGTMSQAQINKYLDKTKTAENKILFLDKVARQIARQHTEVAQGMEKEAIHPGLMVALPTAAGAGIGAMTSEDRLRGALRGGLIGGGIGSGVALGSRLGAYGGAAPGMMAGNLPLALGGAAAGGLLGGAAGGVAGGHLGGRLGRAVAPVEGDEQKEKREKKASDMTKQDAFTTPESQAKAKMMQRAMKATKGAPPNVRKSAVKMVGKKMQNIDTTTQIR